MSDLAAALREVGEDKNVLVKVWRDGQTLELEWIPFPEDRCGWVRHWITYFKFRLDAPPGNIIDPFWQFGFVFVGYPLEFTHVNRLGTSEVHNPNDVTLPPGSYLFLLRKEGYADTRFPVLISGAVSKEQTAKVQLLRQNLVPPGFIYVPAGEVATGGDFKGFQRFDWDEHDVPGFFISEYELTWAEWGEFVNANSDRIDEAGRIEPLDQEVVEQRIAFKEPKLIPVAPNRFWGLNGSWTLKKDGNLEEYAREEYHHPARGILHHAALEYLYWRNKVAKERGEPWRYRLPDDLEWERAARGVDRRHFVWGNHLSWTFCWSGAGNLYPLRVTAGAVAADESVFGVRDMEGSVQEHNTGRLVRSHRTVRGASYRDTNDEYLRLASRNGLPPHRVSPWHGVRLVADLVDQETAGR